MEKNKLQWHFETCKTCNGQRNIITSKCEDCGGAGFHEKDITDIIALPLPTKKEKRIIKSIFSANRNWVSVRSVKNCLFSRRNGYTGFKILGLSICIRLFGLNLTNNRTI